MEGGCVGEGGRLVCEGGKEEEMRVSAVMSGRGTKEELDEEE